MLTKIWYFLEKSLRFILIHIFHFKFSVDTWNHLIQFVKFGIIGISNTLISYLIYLSALFFLQKNNLWPNIDYLLAQFAGFMLSVLWSFYWNRKYGYWQVSVRRFSENNPDFERVCLGCFNDELEAYDAYVKELEKQGRGYLTDTPAHLEYLKWKESSKQTTLI